MDNQNDEMRRAIAAVLSGNPIQRKGAIQRPALIDDLSAPAEKRAEALEHYAGAVMETPVSDWTPDMRAAVKQVSEIVLKRGW